MLHCELCQDFQPGFLSPVIILAHLSQGEASFSGLGYVLPRALVVLNLSSVESESVCRKVVILRYEGSGFEAYHPVTCIGVLETGSVWR